MTEDPNLERETAALLGRLRAAPPPAARERAFAAVQREFEESEAEAIPTTARASAGSLTGVSG